VRWSDGAEGRVPRLAQRRVILFFWPILASSPNQISISPGSRPRRRAIVATVVGQFYGMARPSTRQRRLSRAIGGKGAFQ